MIENPFQMFERSAFSTSAQPRDLVSARGSSRPVGKDGTEQ